MIFSLFSHWNSNVRLRERWQNSTNSVFYWGVVLHASLSECGHKGSHNNRLGRGASINNRISIQLLLFEEVKTWTQKVSPQSHLCDGRTETWWDCRTCQRPHIEPVVRYWPSLNVQSTHSGSCQLVSSSRREIHKGNVLSYSSLFLVYWTNNGFTPASPCSTKGITGSSTWFLMTFHTTWYWIYMTSTIGKTCSWCSVVFPLTVTEHGGGLTRWFQMMTEGNCCLRRN